MSMSNSIFDFNSQVVSVQDVARHYKSLFAQVNRDKRPIVVFNRSTPTVAIIDMKSYAKLEQKKRRAWEMKKAMKAIAAYEKEKKAGKLITLTKLSDLTD